MAFHHIEAVVAKGLPLRKIELLIGMTPLDGISEIAHNGFVQLSSNTSSAVKFVCSYIRTLPPVHSKAYCWLEGSYPKEAFVGSSNYTQSAFIRGQRELCTKSNPVLTHDYFDSLVRDSIYCTHPEAERYTEIYSSRRIHPPPLGQVESSQQDDEYFNTDEKYRGLECETIEFLDRSKRVPARSGLNWGQRIGRHPDQAYLPIRGDARNSGFFPPLGEHFTILADDGAVLICRRAQADGKAIETPHDNSILGKYFRGRLELSAGEFVRSEHLLAYGRTSAKIYKIDDENYYLDFCRPS
jgi:hypothetical protein